MITAQTIHLDEAFTWNTIEFIVTVDAGYIHPPHVVEVTMTRERMLKYPATVSGSTPSVMRMFVTRERCIVLHLCQNMNNEAVIQVNEFLALGPSMPFFNYLV